MLFRSTFRQKPPAPRNDQENENKVLFTCDSKPHRHSKAAGLREVPSRPELTLEAPLLEDDFYLNLLDWSRHNILAIALRNEAFLWNAASGAIEKIECLPPGSRITSVRWSGDGDHLAVGTDLNCVQLWDAKSSALLRTMPGHQARVSSLSWNKFVLSSAGKDTAVLNHDVRTRKHVLSSFCAHSSEVCGLEWSPAGHCLASGGNDNLVAL